VRPLVLIPLAGALPPKAEAGKRLSEGGGGSFGLPPPLPSLSRSAPLSRGGPSPARASGMSQLGPGRRRSSSLRWCAAARDGDLLCERAVALRPTAVQEAEGQGSA